MNMVFAKFFYDCSIMKRNLFLAALCCALLMSSCTFNEQVDSEQYEQFVTQLNRERSFPVRRESIDVAYLVKGSWGYSIYSSL